MTVPCPRAPDARLLFSERSHLSGVSVQFDGNDRDNHEAVTLELRGLDSEDLPPLRVATIAMAQFEADKVEHVYWSPLIDSRRRFFRLRATGAAGKAVALLEANLIHSAPEPYYPLPRALLFSPVSQCNLNCTHCISRPTRARLRVASETVWQTLEEVTRLPDFLHLATDYSGDILFDEVRHPGTLARIIALDTAFRIDTNANCLDDRITDLLLASRLFEINFSIDSMDPEMYARIRRGSIPLGDVLTKVARFMARKREAGRQIHTVISFVLMRSNAATIKPALAFARDNGVDHVNVVPLLAFTQDMVEEVFVWDQRAFAALHDDLTAEARRLGVALALPAPVKRWRTDDIHAPCEVAWGTATILANGDVMACCMPGTVMGNLHEQSLAEIWLGDRFAAFRARVNSPDPPASCRNCGMARVNNNRKAYAPVYYGVTDNAAPGAGK